MVQQSLLNDTGLKDFGALAITEPYAWKSKKGLIITPLSHTKWDKIIPPIQHNRYWIIRNMIWIKKENMAEWKCKAVTKEYGEHKRIRVLYQNEKEKELIKKAVEKIPVRGLRLLRDQWYSFRIDNINRTAVLDNLGNIKEDSIDTFNKENDVQIAKIAWLSDKSNGKTYESMLIYLVKEEEIIRLLKGNWFNAGGESEY